MSELIVGGDCQDRSKLPGTELRYIRYQAVQRPAPSNEQRVFGGKILSMEARCENCGQLIEPINDPNPATSSDDPPDYDLLCARCRARLETDLEE